QGFLNAWNSFWGDDPQSTASKIEDKLDGTLQDMIDDLWAQHVQPVIESLVGFTPGITINQLRADDHGLIVTADVNATNGVTIPGIPTPFDVSNAEDSGANSDVNALLANRTSAGGDSHVIASVHPNVANQFMSALNQALSGQLGGSTPVPAIIEDVLLDPSVHGSYPDGSWTVSLSTVSPDVAPFTQPTGTGGSPRLRVPDMLVRVRNLAISSAPLATFQGSMDGIDVTTKVHDLPGGDRWGPTLDPSGASVNLAFVSGNTDVTAFGPDPADMLPFTKLSIQQYVANILVPFVSLAPIEIGTLSVDLCITCGRYAGDERYSETFKVT
ncbi:MAG: hypothetical protein ACRDX9_06475, partial [Acidimicrobiia bacterium]